MIRFLEWPWAVAFAVLLPVAGAIALIIGRRSRIRRLALLGTRTMLARLAPLGTRRGPWHNVRIVTSLALLGAAVSGPRWGQESSVVRGVRMYDLPANASIAKRSSGDNARS